MSYIGTEPKDIRSFGRTKFDYTASQGQTAFTGADDDGKVLAFTTGQIEVFVNGILMDDSDFTTTGTGTVTLASAANLNDVISIVSFESNIPDNDYVPASGGTFTGAVTASNGLTVDDDGATPLTVDRATSNGTLIRLEKDGTQFGNIGSRASASGSDIFIGNSASDRGNIKFTSGPSVSPATNAGAANDNGTDLGSSSNRFRNLYLSGGAYLGGTTSANYLDDYEEGTFTPFLNALSQNPTYSAQVGRYTKVGRVCTVYIRIHTTSFNSGTGNISIGGLPFTQTSGPYAVGSFFGLFGWEDYDNIVPQFNTNANTIDLYHFVKYAGSNYITINNTHLHSNGGASFMFTIQATYEVQ